MKKGEKVARLSWDGAFIYLVPGSTFQVNRAPLMGIYPEGTTINYKHHIDIRNIDGTCGVWTASQDDLMADDWIRIHTLRDDGTAALQDALNNPRYEGNEALTSLMKTGMGIG